jgi:hypothetical protein
LSVKLAHTERSRFAFPTRLKPGVPCEGNYGHDCYYDVETDTWRFVDTGLPIEDVLRPCAYCGESEVILRVLIPADLSYNGQMRWACKGVDACIAPIIQALNDGGIYTASCCCGHGKEDGTIYLHDGRILRIVANEPPSRGRSEESEER